MNGIAAFFARESVPDFKQILQPMCNAYLDYSNKRHIDATIIKPNREVIEWDQDHDLMNMVHDDYWENFDLFYSDNMKVGDLIIFAVGTQIGSGVQYDSQNQIVFTNNSSNIRTFEKHDPVTDYLMNLYIENQRDMKRTLEKCDQCDINLLACDLKKMNLMSAHDGHAGIQMCHAYIKGIGFMLHQNMVCLRNIIHHFTDCSQDAVNLWETWYGHPLEPEVIRETDLESGSMRKIKFNPKWSY